MKNKNKIIQILFFIITLNIFWYTNATDVNLNIKNFVKLWDHTLKINFDSQIPDDRTYTSDMKIFKDIWIEKVTKDTVTSNKITLSLNDKVKIWSTYNILSVFGIEWSADFIVENGLNIKMLSTVTEKQWITKIVLKDNKTIELYFKTSLVWNEFEFKWLEDLNITEIKGSSWSLIWETSSIIENNKDYILIFMSLADNMWNNYLLSDSIHSFTIWDKTYIEETKNEISKNEAINNFIIQNTSTWKTFEPENNLWNIENWSWSVWNVEKIAIKAKETPDTWPETWILMFLTLIINSIYFLTRKKSL